MSRVKLLLLLTVGVLTVAVATLGAAKNEFISTWKSPEAAPMSFAGRKVVALVIVDDESLRMSSEEARAREVTARGRNGAAASRIIPREELTKRDRAKGWFEPTGVEGLVVMRLVDAQTE